MSAELDNLNEICEMQSFRSIPTKKMQLSLNLNLLRKNVPEINDIDDVHRVYAPVLYFTKDRRQNERKLE